MSAQGPKNSSAKVAIRKKSNSSRAVRRTVSLSYKKLSGAQFKSAFLYNKYVSAAAIPTKSSMNQSFGEIPHVLHNDMEPLGDELAQSRSDAVGSPAFHLRIGISFDKLRLYYRSDKVFVSRKRTCVHNAH